MAKINITTKSEVAVGTLIVGEVVLYNGEWGIIVSQSTSSDTLLFMFNTNKTVVTSKSKLVVPATSAQLQIRA